MPNDSTESFMIVGGNMHIVKTYFPKLNSDEHRDVEIIRYS